MNLEAKLRKQQIESEVDSKWLQQEETNLVNQILFLFCKDFFLIWFVLFQTEKSPEFDNWNIGT